jgi:hypothetical protein
MQQRSRSREPETATDLQGPHLLKKNRGSLGKLPLFCCLIEDQRRVVGLKQDRRVDQGTEEVWAASVGE